LKYITLSGDKRPGEFRMRSIGFDARMAGYTGIGSYIRKLLGEYSKMGFMKFVTVYGDDNNSYLNKITEGRIIRASVPVYSISEQVFFACESGRSGVFHSPHYNAPVFFTGKLISTIHDLTHLKRPQDLPSAKALVYARCMLKAVSKRASKIITSSESVKSDIIKMLGMPDDKITVIPLAAGEEFSPVQDAAMIDEFKAKYNLPEKFILYTGNMKKHKNLGVLLEAYKNLFKKRKINEALVLSTAGRPDRSLMAKSKEWGISENVKFLPFIPSPEMPLLYNSAEVFVFPSLSEGFGLPVLEAMACGVPCAVSNAASLPEVSKGAALLCDPASPQEFEKAVYDLLTDSTLAGSLSKAGIKRAASFSWAKTAARTIKVYNSCSEEL
jgi:glycosyltransferase involved in cell wall biosynthesis